MYLLAPLVSWGECHIFCPVSSSYRHDDCALARGEPAEVAPEGKLVKTGNDHIIVSLPKMHNNIQFHVDFFSVP
jgi:hypothetical protein